MTGYGRDDLIWALVVVSIVAVGGLILGWWLGRRSGKRVQAGVAIGVVSLIAAYLFWGRDTVLWVRWLPVSGAIVLSNPTPWLAAIVAGLCLGQKGLPWWRRGLVALPLVVAGFYSPVELIRTQPPNTLPQWVDDVAIQSNQASCTAAAAASLLRWHGLDYTERDMADLCLTNPQGTPMLGLYRGLSRAVDGAGLRPVMLEMSLDELRRRPELLPAVVSVQLTAEVNAQDPRYSERWGWIPGVRHSVVFFEMVNDDAVQIGDPGVGPELWHFDDIHHLWVGDVTTLKSIEN